MKHLAPPQQLRILLSNLTSTFNFSLQTAHNAIQILMHPNLPELANQDPDICVAALFLSQKLHETQPVSILALCDRSGVSQGTVLAMELMLVGALRGRLYCGGLLVDQCMAVAGDWDRFCRGVTCIDVRFFQEPKCSRLTKFAHKTLSESVEKLAYRLETYKQSKTRLSLAVIALCIKQIERYQIETELAEINIGSECKKMHKKMTKMGKIEHSSTDFIIEDFLSEVYGLGFGDIKGEREFVRTAVFGLRDLTSRFRSVGNVMERNPLGKQRRV